MINPNQKAVDKIIGKQRVPHGYIDSDGDGVKNFLDCKPYDKKKQGMIHRLAARAAEKVGATGTAERMRSRGEHVDEVRKLRLEKRRELEKERVVYKEEERDKSQRQKIKIVHAAKKPIRVTTFGFIDSFTKGQGSSKSLPNLFGSPSSNVPSVKPVKKKVVSYKKIKGGKYKKIVSYKPSTSQPPPQQKKYEIPKLF